MGLAEEGYIDEDMEEDGPLIEGDGRTWDGGTEGGGIREMEGGLEPGVCC